MKLTGSYKLNVKKEVVWDALNNPDILKKCIPGCESFTKESETSFAVTATNQIGPMNATFSGNVNLSNIKQNQSYTISGEGQSAVGFANGTANIKIDEINGVSTLMYDVEVNVGGKIAQLGSRLIDGVAKKMSDYFFGRFADLVSPIKTSSEGEVAVEKNRVKELKSNYLNKYVYTLVLFLLLLVVVIFYIFSR